VSETGAFSLAFGAIVLGVLLVLVVAMFIMSRVFSGVSGWGRLAETFGASHRLEGTTFTRQHMRVGAVRYRNCATIIIAPEGLYLAVASPVLGNHPPLLIPWSAIGGVRPARLYWLSARQLDIGRPRLLR